MLYPCEFTKKSDQIALSIRTRSAVGDLSEVLGAAYCKISQYLVEIGEKPAGPPYVAYFNMDMQDLDIEIGFPVSKKLDGKGNIQCSDIPGGQFAACLFTGPYSEIEAAYTALAEWTKAQGFSSTGTAYEIYLNDPSETPPAKLQTQILFPLQEN